jgi:murein DD-endopeptidase MepM/ murein hydrolase activator NlpD
MPARHSVCLPRATRERLLLACALLTVAVPAAPAGRAHAAAEDASTSLHLVGAERALSDDPLVDQVSMASEPGSPGAVRTVFAPLWPTAGQITTHFGDVSGYSPHGHSGLDVAGPVGTPVVAADAGEIVKADWDIYGYGRLVIVAHVAGYETWYGHLSAYDVEAGQHVRRGEQIGKMGSSGMSTGSHLHFEVRENGHLRDPLRFLSESELQPSP